MLLVSGVDTVRAEPQHGLHRADGRGGRDRGQLGAALAHEAVEGRGHPVRVRRRAARALLRSIVTVNESSRPRTTTSAVDGRADARAR